MRYLVEEKKVLLAFLFICLGGFLIIQVSLFSTPVVVSEKGLALFMLAIILLVSGLVQAVKAIRKA